MRQGTLKNVANASTLLLGLLCILMFVPTACLSQSSPPCKIKLGVLLPLTGPAALIGDRSSQAATLALELLPQSLRDRIQLVFEDTEMKPATGFKAAQKLLSSPEVVGIFGFGSETVGAAADFIERKHIPAIFVTPDRKPIVGKDYLFRHWVAEEDMRAVLLPQLKVQNIRKVAVIYSEIPAMTGFATDLIASSKINDLTVSYHNNVLPSETDFKTAIASALLPHPQAIFFFLLPPQTSTFVKQLRSINKDIPLFSYINTENSQEVTAAGGALEGVRYAGPKFKDEFIETFYKRFSEYPEFASGNVFDIVNIYAEALKSGACSANEMRGKIASTSNFTGALGTYGIRDKNDFRFPVQLKEIKEGRFQFIK